MHNEEGGNVGRVEDLIVTPDKTLSCAIIRRGDWTRFGRHHLVVPINQLYLHGGKLVLERPRTAETHVMPRCEFLTGK